MHTSNTLSYSFQRDAYSVELTTFCVFTCICNIFLVSDGMIEFLCSSKLCELLVTCGLMDVEPCVKASAILSLSSVVTSPPLAKVFMQQRSDHFVSMYVRMYHIHC